MVRASTEGSTVTRSVTAKASHKGLLLLSLTNRSGWRSAGKRGSWRQDPWHEMGFGHFWGGLLGRGDPSPAWVPQIAPLFEFALFSFLAPQCQ